MNRPLRKLIAFSAATAMLANIPLIGANAKYVAEQIGDKEFDSMIQYPDRNVYIENGRIEEFSADNQLVVVGADGTTKLISLSEGLAGGISYASTTMGIYDFFAPTTAEFGFDFYDPNYRLNTRKGNSIVIASGKAFLVDTDGKMISEGYTEIFPIDEDYFEVKNNGCIGVIDKNGNVIIAPSDEIACVYLTSDKKNFFVDGNEKDYFTDLSGKIVSSVYQSVASASIKNYPGWSRSMVAGETLDFILDLPYYSVCKDNKYSLLIDVSSPPVTDYFDELNISLDREAQTYGFNGRNKKYDEDGNFNYKYDESYFDENGKKVKKLSDSDYDSKEYDWMDRYYWDENGQDIDFMWLDEKYKCSTVRYYLHKKNYDSNDGLYDQILDENFDVLFEADSIKGLSYPFGFYTEKDNKVTVLNGKLEKVNEFDDFKESGAVGGFIGRKGDKYYIYDRTLNLINENADAALFDFSGSYFIGESKIYYSLNGPTVSLFDSSYKEFFSHTIVPQNEGAMVKMYTSLDKGKLTLSISEYRDESGNEWLASQSQKFYFNNQLELLSDNEYDTIKCEGDYFFVYNNDDTKAKLILANGDFVRELAKDTIFLENGNYVETEDGVVSFSDATGKLIRKFNSNYGFKTVSISDITNIIINDKNKETGVSSSYLYDLTTDTIKYSQSGKYDMIDIVFEDYIRVKNCPDGATEEGLWTDDSGYEIGLVRIDGVEMIAPSSGQTVSFETYCYGSYSRPDYRDFAIDTIYNNGQVSEWYSDEEYLNPMGKAEDFGAFVVLNDVFIPLRDLDPEYSSTYGYDAAIKLQYGTYVVIKDGKWGIAGADGKALSDLKYERICEFADGIAWTTIKEERKVIAEERTWVPELFKFVEAGEEYTLLVQKLGLITKDGKEIVEPYYDGTFKSNHYDIERFGNTYYTRAVIDPDKGRYYYEIYKGVDYFNDFTEKYDYDTAVKYGDLYLVSKDGLYGVVTADNEVVVPVEFIQILWFPASEKIAMEALDDETKEILSDQLFSYPISELEDGSKLINVKTVKGKIRAYQIYDVEETTTTSATTTKNTTTTSTSSAISTTVTSETTTVSKADTTTLSIATTTTTSSTSPAISTTTSSETTTVTKSDITTLSIATTTSSSSSVTFISTKLATTSSLTTTEGSHVTTTSASDEHSAERYVGTWKVSKRVDSEGNEDEGWSTSRDGEELMVCFILNDDYTGKFGEINKEGKYHSGDITWAINDNIMSIIIDDESIEFRIENDTLIFDGGFDDGKDYYFMKDGDSENELGDANSDGNIDAKDASFILTEYARLSTGGESTLSDAQKKATDVNGDGNTDAKDASVILAYYSYLSTGGSDSLKVFLNT